MKLQTILLAAALTGTGMTAQTLTKEIVIEREVEATLPDASRISSYPTLIQPQVPTSRLPFFDTTAATRVPGMLTTLEPAEGQPAYTLTPYRGYASLGYFPAYNLGISAGYAIISDSRTSLNAWTQFNGSSYKDQYDESLSRNKVTIGADFAHLFGGSRRLNISADFSYDAYNRPWETIDDNHHATEFDINAAWSARAKAMAYYVTAGFNHFGLSGEEVGFAAGLDKIAGVGQNIVKVSGGAAYFLSEQSSLNAHVGVSFVHDSRYNTIINMPAGGLTAPVLMPGDGETMGLITFAPSYRYSAGAFSTSIGAKVQLTTNTGKTFHVAPDVKFNVRPASTFAATLAIGGGEHINKLSALHSINPYMSVAQSFKFSEVPLTANLAVTVGPFYGASVELFGGYTIANDWLMPDVAEITGAPGVETAADRAIYGNMFTRVDLRALHYGAKLAWKYNKNIAASVKYTGAPGSYRHSYYLNADRARHVVEAKVEVTPIAPLTVEASIDWRAGRSIYSHWGIAEEAEPQKYDLRNASSLNIGATYRFNDWVSAFAHVENILGRRAYMYNMLEQQGVHGLVGAAIKF